MSSVSTTSMSEPNKWCCWSSFALAFNLYLYWCYVHSIRGNSAKVTCARLELISFEICIHRAHIALYLRISFMSRVSCFMNYYVCSLFRCIASSRSSSMKLFTSSQVHNHKFNEIAFVIPIQTILLTGGDVRWTMVPKINSIIERIDMCEFHWDEYM